MDQLSKLPSDYSVSPEMIDAAVVVLQFSGWVEAEAPIWVLRELVRDLLAAMAAARSSDAGAA